MIVTLYGTAPWYIPSPPLTSLKLLAADLEELLSLGETNDIVNVTSMPLKRLPLFFPFPCSDMYLLIELWNYTMLLFMLPMFVFSVLVYLCTGSLILIMFMFVIWYIYTIESDV